MNSSPSMQDLIAQVNAFEQSASASSASVLEDFFKLREAFSRRKLDIWSRLGDASKCAVALGHLASSHCASNVRRIATSPWKLDTQQLLREFGPRSLMSRSLVSNLARFATHAPPMIDSQRALAMIREARANRLESKDSGVQRSDYIQPVDVRTAMDKGNVNLNVTTRKRKRRGASAEPSSAVGLLDATADYLSDSASDISIEHARNQLPPGGGEDVQGTLSPRESIISDDEAAGFVDESDFHASPDHTQYVSPTPDSHGRTPIRHPTPASPKAPRRGLGKMLQTKNSWPDTEQSDLMRAVKPKAPGVPDNMGVGTGSKAPLQILGKMQQTEYGWLDTEHSQDDSMPTVKPRAPVSDNMHVGTGSNGQSGRPLERQTDGLMDTEQSQDDSMPAVKPRAPVPDNMHVGTSSNGRSGRPLKRRIFEPPVSLARANMLGTHGPPSPSRIASSSQLREAAQIGQPEQQPDATAATRRRLSPRGWLSSTDISRLIAKFIQPDSRLLDIGRSGDGGAPWSEWTAHYTLNAEHKHVLVPVHMARSHWILLHLDIPASRARVYDSLAPSLTVRDAEDMARAITRSMDISWDGSWKVEMVTHVRQTGTDDCGVFIIIFAIYILARAPLLAEPNAPLWRLLFQYLLLGEIETGIDHLIQDDQAVQGSESRHMVLGLHEAAAKAKKLSKLDRDLSVMSRPVLDMIVKTSRRVEQDAMAIEAQSAHIEDHRRSLAYHFPSSSSEQQAPRASSERDMMAAVLGWMETKVVRLKAARAAAQAGAKEMQAGYQALKDLVDTAIAESDESLRRARVATDEAARILGELGK